MKLSITVNSEGIPGLKLEAENVAEKRQLKFAEGQLHKAQLPAVRRGMADRHNACGSSGDDEGIRSLYISLLLGGHPHHIVWPDEAEAQAKVTILVEGAQGAVGSRVRDLIQGLLGEDALLRVNLM